MKGGKQELSSVDFETELKQDIREAAANLVKDVISRAREMAQRPMIQHQEFSVVEEENEDAILEEEQDEADQEEKELSTRKYVASNRCQSFSGPTPEIQIDFVGDRTPSPDEPSSYVALVYKRQVKIRHEDTSSSDESDANDNANANANDNNNNNNNNNNDENKTSKPANAAPKCIGNCQDYAAEGVPDSDGGAKNIRKKTAKEYMSSKPASLPFVDDSPPGLSSAESPSEATISARVATTKSPQTGDLKTDMKKDPSLRHFVEEYIQGIAEQAQLLADERARKSIPHAKYHSPTDGVRTSVNITVKSTDGSWYNRARDTLSRCLQSTCFCIKLSRQPEAV